MKKTMVLWSAIAIQAIMHVVLGSFGIMSLTNMKSGGFVIAAYIIATDQVIKNVVDMIPGESFMDMFAGGLRNKLFLYKITK